MSNIDVSHTYLCSFPTFFFSLTILTFNDAFVTTVLQLGVLAICF